MLQTYQFGAPIMLDRLWKFYRKVKHTFIFSKTCSNMLAGLRIKFREINAQHYVEAMYLDGDRIYLTI